MTPADNPAEAVEVLRTCACENVEFGTYDAQVELMPPPFLRRDDGRGICVDACLALEVSKLWRAGVKTTGCCCGHGRLEPTICVDEQSVSAMSDLGYVRSTVPHDPLANIYTAKSGWPMAAPTEPQPRPTTGGEG